jgi:dynein heavy chain, axonemal
MDEETREKCAEILQFFHCSTQEWAHTFYNELGRKYYVTPTSYLEMINSFK